MEARHGAAMSRGGTVLSGACRRRRRTLPDTWETRRRMRYGEFDSEVGEFVSQGHGEIRMILVWIRKDS